MSTEFEVENAVIEFWNREDEYLLLEPNEFIAALPEHLLPKKNYLPPLLLTKNQWIYRARPNDASYMQGNGKNVISNYSFSPKKYTIQGRANHVKSPMFYASEFIGATAFESRWDVEKDALVGCWKIKGRSPDLRLAVCASRFRAESRVNIKDKIPASIRLQLEFLDALFSSDREKRLWIEYTGDGEEQLETPRDKIHKLSAAIAQYLMAREGVDGILYHSAQAQGSQAVFPPFHEANSLLNIAISPKYVAKNMRLEKVYRVNISNYYDENGRRRATRKAIRIGIPINKTRLGFSKLSVTQNEKFETHHNSSGVPFLLEGPLVLIIPKPDDFKKLEEIVKNQVCGKHHKRAEIGGEVRNEIDYATLDTCCDVFCDELKERLRLEEMWWD